MLQNGERIAEVEITEAEGWSYTFKDVEAYDEEGQAYTYTIEEEPVEGYETTIYGYDITNLRVGSIHVAGTKTWVNDQEALRPASIIVELFQNGKKVRTLEVTEQTNWNYDFGDLPLYDEYGVLIHYAVDEVKVANYETTIEGFNLINTYVSQVDDNKETDEHGEGNQEKQSETDETKEEQPKLETVGVLPNTATNSYLLLLIGGVIVVLGATTLIVYNRIRNRTV